MAIVISAETEMKLRDRADREGRDPVSLAEAVLSAFLSSRGALLGPDIPYVDDDDYVTLDALIAQADAEFAAGRFKSLDQVRVAKREQFGIEL